MRLLAPMLGRCLRELLHDRNGSIRRRFRISPLAPGPTLGHIPARLHLALSTTPNKCASSPPR
ncbi:hypothetical protein E2562_033606 [Oryza meyeriana var. granulata]|uniref:Uncharacterized protein n=1 Tax=Oryza meyeriana var. granulata TaxID=110450 RepID=A0A6G1DA33_9ORYZ|nr:hypothetical protein E2562_033606 [Oryza meyeriana var. granulata]